MNKKYKVLKEIRLDEDTCENYRFRTAARAVLFDDKGEIALPYIAKHGYHKLPGGGVEDGEDVQSALVREMMEEVGCGITVAGTLGAIVEFRNKFNLVQTSICFFGHVQGEIKNLALTDSEKANGFVLQWHTLDNAINLLEKEKPSDYEGRYIVNRDLTFLLEYKRSINA
jgi:8-oxo-dGTP pyrophosphatase MutT (NUDIX family)